MRILITNDDGLFAKGIYELAKVLEEDHELIIVAPDTEQSAKSHAITILRPMVIKHHGLKDLRSPAYSVSGTPADCVRVAIEAISTEAPFDMVVSGINFGLNAGMDVLYSGTVSAAIEANLYGLPSIAVSCQVHEGEANFSNAAPSVRDFIRQNGENLLEHKILLNMNFPYEMEEGARLQIAEIGDPIFDYYHLAENEEGDMTLTAKGRKDIRYAVGTDRFYLDLGHPTITPLQYNFTNRAWMERLADWNA